MIRETAGGRPVYLRRTRFGYVVKWGRTVIVRCADWKEALQEIVALFEVER